MGDIYTNPPQSRNEAILRATIDGTEYEAPPQSRMEDLLVELKAVIEQGAGTGSYNDLSNKPQIGGVTLESELDKLDKADMTSEYFSERGIDGEYQITRISNEIHIAVAIDDASIATQTGSVDLIADLPDEFKCDPSYGAVLALRHSSGTGKIEFKINPGITQSFYMYVEEVNAASGVWFPIYDVPGKAL